MTVPIFPARSDFTGSGIAGPFPYYFKVFTDSEIAVYKTLISTGVQTTLTLTTDYTVSGAGNDDGGSVTLTSTLSADYTLSIQSVPNIEQQTDIRNESGFFPDSIEDQFDRCIAIDKKQQEEITRAIVIPAGDAAEVSLILPNAAERASKVLAFDSNGAVTASATVAGGVTVSSTMTPFVAAASLQSARTLLGVLDEYDLKADFNCIGDGITDDYTALQAAFDSGRPLKAPPGKYLTTRPLVIANSGTTLRGMGANTDGDQAVDNFSVVIGTKTGFAIGSAAYDALLVLRKPSGDISNCRFENISFLAGDAQNVMVIEKGYSNYFTNCRFWYTAAPSAAANGWSIRFEQYSGTNRFLNCHSGGFKNIGMMHYDANTYHLYNTFINHRILGGVTGVVLEAGCVGNTFVNLMCDLTSLSTYAVYGSVAGLASKADVRGYKTYASNYFGAYPGNTFNSITNCDFENTEAYGTAFDANGTDTLLTNATVSSGYLTSYSATSTGMRSSPTGIVGGNHVTTSRIRWFNGFFEGLSEDSTITWNNKYRINVTRDSTYKQFTFPWGKTPDPSALITEIRMGMTTDSTVTYKIEIYKQTYTSTSDTSVYTSGDLAYTSGDIAVNPNVAMSDGAYGYYIRMSVKGTGGTFMYIHPIRVTHVGTGE